MFNKFPREVGLPRKTVNNIKEWLKFINLYNGKKKAVYTSVYSFKILDQVGNKPMKPEYNSAVIDKLFFDFDDKSCEAWKECNKFHQELLKKNIKHIMIMSGRGYHLYIFTHPYSPKNVKSTIYNAQMNFVNSLNLLVDKQVIGNPAQLARVPNTYNVRGKRFCIPLTKEQFEKGDDFIKQSAVKQNFVKNTVIGKHLLNLEPFDYSSSNEQIEYIVDDNEESSGNLDYEKDLPDCIKRILSKKDIGWKGRYLIILYFKEMGHTREEVFQILKNHLSERKLQHCVHEERQLQYLFDRHDLVFPSCEKIMEDGFCNKKCLRYGKIIYK